MPPGQIGTVLVLPRGLGGGEAALGHDLAGQEGVGAVDARVDDGHGLAGARVTGGPCRGGTDAVEVAVVGGRDLVGPVGAHPHHVGLGPQGGQALGVDGQRHQRLAAEGLDPRHRAVRQGRSQPARGGRHGRATCGDLRGRRSARGDREVGQLRDDGHRPLGRGRGQRQVGLARRARALTGHRGDTGGVDRSGTAGGDRVGAGDRRDGPDDEHGQGRGDGDRGDDRGAAHPPPRPAGGHKTSIVHCSLSSIRRSSAGPSDAAAHNLNQDETPFIRWS